MSKEECYGFVPGMGPCQAEDPKEKRFRLLSEELDRLRKNQEALLKFAEEVGHYVEPSDENCEFLPFHDEYEELEKAWQKKEEGESE